MTKKKWTLNVIYIAITIFTFSISLFKTDHPVWIAAWIGPIFFIRFMRNAKWIPAVILGFFVMHTAFFIAFMPFMTMLDTTSLKMDFSFLLNMQAKSGLLFLASFSLLPFIVDKALHKHLPKFAASLVFPSTVVAIDLLNSLTIGMGSSYGETQFTLSSFVMTASIFGVFGLSFLISWFASMINCLWEENWKTQELNLTGLVYVTIFAGVLLYGGIANAFPVEASTGVPIAGITLENHFFERMGSSDLYVSEIFDLDPTEIGDLLSSPLEHLQEMRRKTRSAIFAGAKIIVWQEYALTLETAVADVYFQEMKNLADEADVYLLISYIRLLNEAEKDDKQAKNLSVLYTPEGEIGWEYEKAFPAPGYEEILVEVGHKYVPHLDTPYGRIGQAICADMLYPHYIRQAAAKQIDLLLVPAFDSVTLSPFLTFSSAYRAVENGFTMVRIAGDGHSAVIDPYYRVWGRQNFQEIGSGNFYVNVPVVSHNTVYAAVGYIFPYAIGLLLLCLIAMAILHRATSYS